MLGRTIRGSTGSAALRFKVAVGLPVLVVAGLIAAIPPARAAQVASVANVLPHDTVGGSSDAEITFSVSADGGPVDDVRIVRPDTLFTVLGGSANHWTATTSPDGYETFTGFVLLPGQTGTFTVDVATGQPAQDTFGHWTVLTSSNGGDTYQVAQGAQNTPNSLLGDVRVLSMTAPVISPSQDGDTLVTEGQKISMTTTVTNRGTGTIDLSASGCLVSGDEAGDVTSGGTYVGAPAALAPGQQAVVELAGVIIGDNTGSGRHLRLTVSTGDGTAVQAAVDVVTIGTPAPYITSAETGFNGSYDTINLRISEPVSGTENVGNWRVVDDQGVAHPVFNVTGSGTAYWVLELSPSPPFTPGWTAGVTYTPGDLHDANGNALPETTIVATSGTTH